MQGSGLTIYVLCELMYPGFIKESETSGTCQTHQKKQHIPLVSLADWVIKGTRYMHHFSWEDQWKAHSHSMKVIDV